VYLIPTTWEAWKTLPLVRKLPARVSNWATLHELLVAGDVDYVTGRPQSLWSNFLVLPNFEVGNRMKLDAEGKITISSDTISLRGRSLEKAVLINARLMKADFVGAHLGEADFARADLREAKFECSFIAPAPREGFAARPMDFRLDQQKCTELQGARLASARLDGANLSGAQLQYADLAYAQLQGAQLSGAHLKGANLFSAGLDGADLNGADLQEAKLYSSWLRGAQLSHAQLKGAKLAAHLTGADVGYASLWGADLSGAELQGANLDSAQLEGADLNYAQLQGASLAWAQLEGTNLDHTFLQGADLDHTFLQGLNLSGAQLQGASLTGTFVWRTDPPSNTNEIQIFVDAPAPGPARHLADCPMGRAPPCVWSEEAYEKLRSMIEQFPPPAGGPNLALQRIATLEKPPYVADEASAEAWAALANASARSAGSYFNTLAEKLKEIGCAADGAPYVIKNLMRPIPGQVGAVERVFLDRRFEANPLKEAEVAAAFLDEEKCPGARGLSEDNKAKLREIRDRGLPAPASPGTAAR
jgi:uncharacterized protein YjbI with pentapeptide repeats